MTHLKTWTLTCGKKNVSTTCAIQSVDALGLTKTVTTLYSKTYIVFIMATAKVSNLQFYLGLSSYLN